MPCYHPLKAFELSPPTANQKAKLKVVPYLVDHLEVTINGSIEQHYDSIRSDRCQRYIWKHYEIPCGKCIGCRLMYSKQWATRCSLESEYHESSYFVTLTYNEDCVPISWYSDPETGEAFQSLTLRKKDFQAFMKRLRFNTGQYIRFYASGEYGDNTYRPHYHAILFGLKLDDLKLYKQSEDGWLYYTSETIQKAWSVPRRGSNRFTRDTSSPIGMCMVTNVNWSTCAYVARYVCKKLKGEAAEFYEKVNIEPPFSLMSRNPGIANQWFQDHSEYTKYDTIPLPGVDAGKRVKPPKYFDYLLDQVRPDELELQKRIRQNMAKVAKLLQAQRTDLDYLDSLEVQERSQESRIKGLKRIIDEGGEF